MWELPALSLDDAKDLMSKDFGRELIKLAVAHMTHFTFGVVNSSGHAEIRSATCFFLKTPRKLLVVTAKHVITAYRQALTEDPATICQIGNLQFEPDDRLAGMGTKADIATLFVTERELEKIAKHPIAYWPPAPPDDDDRGVLLAGYPATQIVMEGPRTGSFGIYAACAVAQRTTDWQLSCKVEWEYVQGIPGLGGLPPRGFDTGGMSGGPVFTILEQNGILSFPLAGVISEGQSARDTIIADCGRSMSDAQISEAGRKARFELWEKLGLDQVKHDLLDGGYRVVGGPPQVIDLAWEWVRMKEAEQRSQGAQLRRDPELIQKLLVKLENFPSRPGDVFIFSGGEPELAIDGYSGEQITYHLEQLKEMGLIDSPGSQPMLGGTFRSLSSDGHDFLERQRALSANASKRSVPKAPQEAYPPDSG